MLWSATSDSTVNAQCHYTLSQKICHHYSFSHVNPVKLRVKFWNSSLVLATSLGPLSVPFSICASGKYHTQPLYHIQDFAHNKLWEKIPFSACFQYPGVNTKRIMKKHSLFRVLSNCIVVSPKQVVYRENLTEFVVVTNQPKQLKRFRKKFVVEFFWILFNAASRTSAPGCRADIWNEGISIISVTR